MSIKKQEQHCYPISRKKNGDPSYKWFPIGWSLNIHDLGNGYDPPDRDSEWVNGNLEYLIDDGNWWVNFVYPIPRDNMEAWGYPMERPSEQWTTTDMYVNLLKYLEKKKNDTKGKIDIKAFPIFLSRTFDTLQFYTSGTWDNIPNDMLNVFIERINLLKNYRQLGGWFIIDEGFAGDYARTINKRDFVRNQILYCKNIIETYDNYKEDHPIYMVERGNGNFNFDPCEKPEYIKYIKDLVGTTDYLCDDMYLSDFLNDGYSGYGDFVGITKTRVEQARKIFIEKLCNVPDTGINKSFMLFSSGCPQTGYINPYTGDSNLTEEQLRYQNYCAWINGSMGCMLWMLSKSNVDSYERGKKISYEAYKASEFLMNPPDSDVNKSYLYINDNVTDCQFVLRKNPTDQKELMLMVCNNSKNNVTAQSIINSDLHIDKIRPLVSGYNWSVIFTPETNRLKFNIDSHTGRAFLITLK